MQHCQCWLTSCHVWLMRAHMLWNTCSGFVQVEMLEASTLCGETLQVNCELRTLLLLLPPQL